MEELVEGGPRHEAGDEYRLQTAEGAEWTKEFNQRRAAVRADAARMSSLRNDWLKQAVDKELAGIKLPHGESKTPQEVRPPLGRRHTNHRRGTVPVWIRDEWSVTEAGPEPRPRPATTARSCSYCCRRSTPRHPDALASYAAADRRDAPAARAADRRGTASQAGNAVASASKDSSGSASFLHRALQGKGLPRRRKRTDNRLASLRHRGCWQAIPSSRLFPKFARWRPPGWRKVITKARDGAPDASRRLAGRRRARATRVQGSACEQYQGGRDQGHPIFIATSVMRPTAGQRTPSTAPSSRYSPTATSGPHRTANRLAAPRSFHHTDRQGGALQGGRPAEHAPSASPSAASWKAAVPYTPDQEGAAISGLLQHLVDLAHNAGGAPPLPAPPSTEQLAGTGGARRQRAVPRGRQHAAQLSPDLEMDSPSSAARSARGGLGDARSATWPRRRHRRR